MSPLKEILKEALAKQTQQEQRRQILIEECCRMGERLLSDLSCPSVFEEVNAEIFGGKAKITKERGSFERFVLGPDYGVKIRLRGQKGNKEVNLVAFAAGQITESGEIHFFPELLISCSSGRKRIGGWNESSYEEIGPARIPAHPDEEASYNRNRLSEVVARALIMEGIAR